MPDGPHYLVQRAAKRNPFACRDNPFTDANSHLSLGEIVAREAMARYRRKLSDSGIEFSEADAARWATLNRVPRRPPIYNTEPAPKGAA